MMKAPEATQQNLLETEKRLEMKIVERFGLKVDKPETFDRAIEKLLAHKEEIIPPENEQNFINAIRNLQREAGIEAASDDDEFLFYK